MLISESEWEKTEKQKRKAIERRAFKRYSKTTEWLDRICAVCRLKEMEASRNGETSVVTERLMRIASLWRQYRIMRKVVKLLEEASMHVKDTKMASFLNEVPYIWGIDSFSAHLSHCDGTREGLEVAIFEEIDTLFESIEDLAADLAAEEGEK